MSVTVERSFHFVDINGKRGGLRRSLRLGTEPTAPPASDADSAARGGADAGADEGDPGQGPAGSGQRTKSKGRVPRVARLMALAIRCDNLLRTHVVPDASALARLAHVTQPRITQILNLTLLAPDIQEMLLCLPPVEKGKPTIGEKALRRLCAEVVWDRQRQVPPCANSPVPVGLGVRKLVDGKAAACGPGRHSRSGLVINPTTQRSQLGPTIRKRASVPFLIVKTPETHCASESQEECHTKCYTNFTAIM